MKRLSGFKLVYAKDNFACQFMLVSEDHKEMSLKMTFGVVEEQLRTSGTGPLKKLGGLLVRTVTGKL